VKEIKATAPTRKELYQEYRRLSEENERLREANRSMYSTALTVAAALHRVRCALDDDCSDIQIGIVNNNIRLQAIALADHAKKTIGEQNK
jgi:hypothetical protein